MIEGKDLSAPISKALLSEAQRLAVILPVDIAKAPKFELYFFTIMRRYPLNRTYDSELTEIPAGGTIDFAFLGEDGVRAGKDIFEVWEERPFRIQHFGLGISPPEIWLYKSSPADISATGWGYKKPTKVGDKYDYIPGHLSPFEMPTVFSESIVFHKLSFHVGFRNSAGRPLRPSLRILGAGYDTIQIVNTELIESMIAGRIPCRFLTVGSLRDFSYTTPPEWKAAYIVDRAVIERIFERR